ncbi:MAG TPA: large conductance mechanosensitive channel protein MscL [Longimicrobiales bacterium]|nr:large conductance mechanosensitive channel protein MscL [Longimicrobiales bacterium]
MSIGSEFKTFIARGNVIDMAVGIAVGAAFAAVAASLVRDVIMPPLGLLLGGSDFADLFWVLQPGDPAPPYESLLAATEAGAVTVNYGVFINTIIIFLVIAAAIFFVVRSVNRLATRRETAPPAPTDKTCPFCHFTIPLAATRCPHCTSALEGA